LGLNAASRGRATLAKVNGSVAYSHEAKEGEKLQPVSAIEIRDAVLKSWLPPFGRYRLSCKTKSVEMIDRVAQRLFQRWSGTARAGKAGEEDHHKRWQLAAVLHGRA
jgi:hypothetical protein